MVLAGVGFGGGLVGLLVLIIVIVLIFKALDRV